jgi:hypothetical protein
VVVNEWLGISEGALQFVGAAVLLVVLAVAWYRSDWDDVDGAEA